MRFALLFMVIFTVIGCAGPSIQHEVVSGYRFAPPHRWIFVAKGVHEETSTAQRSALLMHLEPQMQRALQQGLEARGYLPSDQQHAADWEVDWSFGEWEKHRQTPAGGGWGSAGLNAPGAHATVAPLNNTGKALPPSVNPYGLDYETARLVVKITDISSHRVLWQAWVEDDGDFGYRPQEQSDEILAVLQKMLATLPTL